LLPRLSTLNCLARPRGAEMRRAKAPRNWRTSREPNRGERD
jgi:hypothetical protein